VVVGDIGDVLVISVMYAYVYHSDSKRNTRMGIEWGFVLVSTSRASVSDGNFYKFLSSYKGRLYRFLGSVLLLT
jgi:hypothetical protein